MSKYFGVPFAESGDLTPVPDAAQPGGDVSYSEGWTADYEADQEVDPNAKDVDRKAENQLKNDITGALKEIQERGFKVYSADVNYPAGSYTVGSDGELYKSTGVNGPGSTVVDPVGDLSGVWVSALSDVIGRTKTTYIRTSGTFTPDPRAKAIRFTAIGGGGGGGAASGLGASSAGCGAGGGAGGAAIRTVTSILPSYTIVIGAGGAGATSVGVNGARGGNTSIPDIGLFGISATEAGGRSMPGTASDSTSITGRSSAGSGGDLNLIGGYGTNGRVVAGNTTMISSGGASILGGSVTTLSINNNGANAINPGCGGSGGNVENKTGTRPGGDGADGIVIAEEFL